MTQQFHYVPQGVCSREMIITMNGETIERVQIIGGCAGNTQGVSRLAEGRNIDEVIGLIDGIKCRGNTSCPDQLAKALKAIKEKL